MSDLRSLANSFEENYLEFCLGRIMEDLLELKYLYLMTYFCINLWINLFI